MRFNLLNSNVFSAILNVLAIIVLALAAGFIILLLVDLILGCIDGKRGVLFFRNRRNSDKDNEILYQYNKDLALNDAYYLQNNDKRLELDFDKQYEKENEPEKTNNIDFAKAEAEQKMLEEKNNQNSPKEDVEVNDDFTFINKVSPEIEKEIDNEDKQPQKAEPEKVEPKKDNAEDDDDDFDFLDDDDDDKSIEEILQAIKERNMKAREKYLEEQDVEPDFEDDDEEESEEEIKNEKQDLENAVEEVENPEPVQDEISLLKAQIEELNKKVEQEQNKNKEIEEKAKQEVENLKKELENKPQENEDYTQEDLETFEAKLAELLERQKQNDKDLKINKKEYLPLARIERSLESDKEKLRRREAIVAKKKMVIFGVNNYEHDEEKEQKLREEIDMLDGLRMSVEHCQSVMDEAKDRYPILKKSNEILTRNAEQIASDIAEVEAKIAKAKEVLGTDNSSNGTEN